MGETRLAMYAEFAAKLQLTSTFLGCASRKDLCARFRRVNPATTCDLDRLHKWAQGRAMPRSDHFYEDWVKVVGLDRPGSWIANCGEAELREALGIQPAEPGDAGQRRETVKAASVRRGAQPSAGPGIFGVALGLRGSYACYRQSWSPHFRGRLIRTSLVLSPGKGQGLMACYSECLNNESFQLKGQMRFTGGPMHFLANHTPSGWPLFLTLFVPGVPASVMCGVVAGQALLSSEPLPSAARLLAIRVPDSVAIEDSNRYLESGDTDIAADLDVLGAPLADPARLNEMAARFFATDVVQVNAAMQSEFAGALDAGYLRASG